MVADLLFVVAPIVVGALYLVMALEINTLCPSSFKLGLIARKPVFGAFVKASFKPVSSATGIS